MLGSISHPLDVKFLLATRNISFSPCVCVCVLTANIIQMTRIVFVSDFFPFIWLITYFMLFFSSVVYSEPHIKDLRLRDLKHIIMFGCIHMRFVWTLYFIIAIHPYYTRLEWVDEIEKESKLCGSFQINQFYLGGHAYVFVIYIINVRRVCVCVSFFFLFVWCWARKSN